MGVAFAFMLYIGFAIIVGLPLAALGALLGAQMAKGTPPSTKRLFKLTGAALPLCAGAYLLVWIVFMAILGLATGRDFGFGDGFDLPLHNGYHWSAIDEPLSACIYKGDMSDMSAACGLPNRNQGTFVDVLAIQEKENWIAGAYDSNEKHFLYQDQQRADRWFLFNTKTDERIDAGNEPDLKQIASQHGLTLHLESSEKFYGHRRYRWYDALVGLLLFVPALIALVWLYKKARRLLRETAETTGPNSVDAGR